MTKNLLLIHLTICSLSRSILNSKIKLNSENKKILFTGHQFEGEWEQDTKIDYLNQKRGKIIISFQQLIFQKKNELYFDFRLQKGDYIDEQLIVSNFFLFKIKKEDQHGLEDKDQLTIDMSSNIYQKEDQKKCEFKIKVSLMDQQDQELPLNVQHLKNVTFRG